MCPQVSRENESLQQRFTAQLPKLLAANEEISSCMLRMQQASHAAYVALNNTDETPVFLAEC